VRIQKLGIQERSRRQSRPFDFDGAKTGRGNRLEPSTSMYNALCRVHFSRLYQLMHLTQMIM
jgi:hypothetical protein